MVSRLLGKIETVADSTRLSAQRLPGKSNRFERQLVYEKKPDLEYMDNYQRAGMMVNCAGEGRCGYTCRPELAVAVARMPAEQRLGTRAE